MRVVCFIFLAAAFASYSAVVPEPGVEERLNTAIQNPEFMLEHWVELPTSPQSNTQKPRHLSLKEAILLALRYNPNIQNTELDRIIQRYQLRLAHNAFELQYALAGTALIEKNNYTGVGNATSKSYLATPELALKNKLGGEAALTMDNNVAGVGGYKGALEKALTRRGY
jgi:hypothetical protein